MNKIQKQFLNNYLDKLNPDERPQHKNICADYFCADEENANMCSNLILAGDKTATCSMKYWYENSQETMPQVGDLHIVTDWNGNPTSIIEITEVTDCQYSKVTPEFAASEGEGDKSLKLWREVHWEFFAAECREQGFKPTEDMMLVLEKFKVVYS